MKKLSTTYALALTLAFFLAPLPASAQQDDAARGQGSENEPVAQLAQNTAAQKGNVPAPVQEAEEAVEDVVERFRIGVVGGVAIDPELIVFGAHGTFAPIFHRAVEFRPGLEFGVGEVTTSFAVNLDVLYVLPGSTRTTRWAPYVGAGPNVGVSHRGFEDDDPETIEENRNRFDFGDTDFDAGFNFIVGARSPGGVFFEMRATAYGVSNVKLLAGYDF